VYPEAADDSDDATAILPVDFRQRFENQFKAVREGLTVYREKLAENEADDDNARIGVAPREHDMVAALDGMLSQIAELSQADDWPNSPTRIHDINDELEKVQTLTVELPSALHERIHGLSADVRVQYRTMIAVTWLADLAAAMLLGLLLYVFYRWVFRPLRVLIKGSRRVASGEFQHRIRIDSSDEMAELAAAMNDMTERFQSIRDDLDRQVQLRTQQVVRNEQLASVGFLAAGVAHEINNPLASIAMCAESLEGRVRDLLTDDEQHKVVKNYLRMIQSEAFRCKEITEKLLDFSRMGEVRRQTVDLRELVCGVIDMVRHLGKYQNKYVVLLPGDPALASVNAQEIKQVVLNLITNGLDSIDAGARMTIEITARAGELDMLFTDNGCGMTPEVLQHIFEPFFTRKRNGQGTGLGLSIAYRIIADHAGHIEATSEGPGRGAQFRVTLPQARDAAKPRERKYQAA
jgi:signal transduction histidine kinase